ncbi:MAG: enoyl-CoA hydratase/isomerase family protein [Alphaproteobacteria bacterium]|nr:enoyl-CoA hydratase/isomerase family protein [Alphaproteobacteria bacterium]
MRTITISAPGMNALGLDVMADIERQFREAGDEPVLLTGAGKAFSAGLNLKEILGLDMGGMERFLDQLMAVSRAIFYHPAPVVAAVNGHAIAGGCILALCADHRVGTTFARSRVGLNEVALGLSLPPVIVRLVEFQLPRTARDEVVLGGGLHGPEDSLRLGLVQTLADDPVAAATARLEAWGANPRSAYASNKRSLRAGVLEVSPEEDARYRAEQLPVWLTGEVRARMQALVGG